MPITGKDLQPGDLLFKHASQGLVSGFIRFGQRKNFAKVKRDLAGEVTSVTRDEATDITHMALAVGKNDVVEFDEGGAGLGKILFNSGYGFVRGDMALESRKGNCYEVFRCLDLGLAKRAADKALMIYDLAFSKGEGGPGAASYGIGKLVSFGGFGFGGYGGGSLQAFENRYHEWVTKLAQGRKPKIKFICSEFAAYCYCWALMEHSKDYRQVPWLLGIDKGITSPVEYYVRINELGAGMFQFKGTMYP